MASGIYFPPPKTSLYCQQESLQLNCATATWSIKVPNRKYEVKITLGDVMQAYKYNISINGKAFRKNKELAPKA